ncbi:urease accessory protein UreF [Bacillus massiliglaciei]|uniref:urease accessory protein UreF n=1 Tax=Bacillus massiliglaciei TaxID=1816693 RepID=UPI002D21A0E3|nr:urease accessory protein UreF [Bacillus massiliglaciei]
MAILMNEGIFPLLQLCDSNFPSGAFSHSFGMETYIQEGKIVDSLTFQEFLGVYIAHTLVYNDGLACKMAYDYLENNEWEKIWELDEILFTGNAPSESREGTRRIGQQMAKLCLELYPSEALAAYYQRMKQKESCGHSAIVFALVCCKLDYPSSLAIEACLYAAVSSLIQNAVRGIPLGQTAGQKLLIWAHGEIQKAARLAAKLDSGDLGRTQPGLEISQMRHERLNVRLFMS